MSSPIRVTVEDLETGVKKTREIPMDDYFLVTTGTATYSVQTYANGTHVITIKGRK